MDASLIIRHDSIWHHLRVPNTGGIKALSRGAQMGGHQRGYVLPSWDPWNGETLKRLHTLCCLGVTKVGRSQSGYNCRQGANIRKGPTEFYNALLAAPSHNCTPQPLRYGHGHKHRCRHRRWHRH